MTLIKRFHLGYWLSLCLFLILTTHAFAASDMQSKSQGSYVVKDILVDPGENYTVWLLGNATPAYTMFELVDPLRIVLDLADASVDETIGLPKTYDEGPVSKIHSSQVGEQQQLYTRFEIFLAEDRGYSVERQGNNIIVKFAGGEAKPIATEPIAPVELQTITDIDITKSAKETLIYIKSSAPITQYKYAQLPGNNSKPARMYIDIIGAAAKTLAANTQVGTSVAQVRSSRRSDGVRFVFDATGQDLFEYEIDSQSDGLLVTIAEPTSGATDLIASLMEGEPAIPEEETLEEQKKVAVKSSPREEPQTAAQPETSQGPLTDTFSFAGYTQKRITVDFYKIDLHNVFRMIGEISGKNIVVDEAVGGSLTLALEDVPWDFALDIIMNLKGLQKEERFNTLVISPASKGFQWPEQATDNIAFKADPITIKQKIETPKEVIGAKQSLTDARAKEDAGEYGKAIEQYKEAFAKWPNNGQIANRIAALSLVHEQRNADAVHYAKQALKIDVDDHDAALLAAIGLANMRRDAEAKEYFDLAVGAAKPTSDALISYAAFLEEGSNYPAGLTMLERHEDLYGDNLNTMISKARMYDKNGDTQKALEEYQAAVLSGYEMPEDLKSYINGRLTFAAQQ